jgi:hypothetical protein
MEPLLAAVIALAVVGVMAVSVAAVAIVVLARSARERQDTLVRAATVTRAIELAEHPADLLPVLESLRPVELPDNGPLSRKNAILQGKEFANMQSVHMDPDDMEDVEVFRAMKEAGLDPGSSDDVRYWNEMGDM